MNKKYHIIFILVWCTVFLIGCQRDEIDKSKIYSVYYISTTETKIEMHQYVMQSVSKEGQVEELLAALATVPAKLEYKAPLSMGFSILDYELEDGKILINLDSNYKELSITTEVLVRAAIVKTLIQLSDINFVAFTIDGTQLIDATDTLVGWMNADLFIENDGNEINTYEEVRLKLYFATEEGNELIITNRTKEYNTNISMEKLIVEELIKGPNVDSIFPTINPSTKVASVTVRDGVCYVNLDENFLLQPYNVTPEVTIFSILHSLVDLTNGNKVQIFINGDNSGTSRERYRFSTYFARNLVLLNAV